MSAAGVSKTWPGSIAFRAAEPGGLLPQQHQMASKTGANSGHLKCRFAQFPLGRHALVSRANNGLSLTAFLLLPLAVGGAGGVFGFSLLHGFLRLAVGAAGVGDEGFGGIDGGAGAQPGLAGALAALAGFVEGFFVVQHGVFGALDLVVKVGRHGADVGGQAAQVGSTFMDDALAELAALFAQAGQSGAAALQRFFSLKEG